MYRLAKVGFSQSYTYFTWRNTKWELEQYLTDFTGALLFVTHDRAFITNLATRIVELDRGTLTSWPGSYPHYLEKKADALETEARDLARLDYRFSFEGDGPGARITTTTTVDPAALSLPEQVGKLSGQDNWRTEPVGGRRAVVVADGPHGVRRPSAGQLGIGEAVPATCFPTASALASSWDPDLLERVEPFEGELDVFDELRISEQIEKAHGELAADPDLLTSTVRNVDAPARRPRKTRKNSKENEK